GNVDLTSPVDDPGGAVLSVRARVVGPVVWRGEPGVGRIVRIGIGAADGSEAGAAVDLRAILVPRASDVIGPGHQGRDQTRGFVIRERPRPAGVLVWPARPPAGAVVNGQRRRKPLAQELPARRRIEWH